jgi:hypothetical protein
MLLAPALSWIAFTAQFAVIGAACRGRTRGICVARRRRRPGFCDCYGAKRSDGSPAGLDDCACDAIRAVRFRRRWASDRILGAQARLNLVDQLLNGAREIAAAGIADDTGWQDCSRVVE